MGLIQRLEQAAKLGFLSSWSSMVKPQILIKTKSASLKRPALICFYFLEVLIA
jgi:hypothetical protein